MANNMSDKQKDELIFRLQGERDMVVRFLMETIVNQTTPFLNSIFPTMAETNCLLDQFYGVEKREVH